MVGPDILEQHTDAAARDEERAAVLAMLGDAMRDWDRHPVYRSTVREIAARIERGDHRRAPDP